MVVRYTSAGKRNDNDIGRMGHEVLSFVILSFLWGKGNDKDIGRWAAEVCHLSFVIGCEGHRGGLACNNLRKHVCTGTKRQMTNDK